MLHLWLCVWRFMHFLNVKSNSQTWKFLWMNVVCLCNRASDCTMPALSSPSTLLWTKQSGIRREVGQNLLMPSHRLLMVEIAAYLTLWSGAYDVVVVCVRGGSNVGISWLIPIKTCGLLFSVSLVYCVMLHDFFRPISELLSHQQAEMPGCCGSWQSSRGGWYRGETVQSEEKSSLSRALAKSREEKERQREREEWGQGGRKEDKRQVAYGSHMVQQLDI